MQANQRGLCLLRVTLAVCLGAISKDFHATLGFLRGIVFASSAYQNWLRVYKSMSGKLRRILQALSLVYLAFSTEYCVLDNL